MAENLITGLGGQADSSSDFAVPPGNALVATNVVFKAAGVVEPRPGFPMKSYGPLITGITSAAVTTYDVILGRWPYQGKSIIYAMQTDVNTDVHNYALGYDSGSAYAQLNDLLHGTYAFTSRKRFPATEAKQTFFLNTALGCLQTTAYNSALTSAGVPKASDIPQITLSGGTGAWTWNNSNSSKVAYSVVWGKKDAFGRVILGAPSGRVLVSNTSGADRFAKVVIPVPTWASSTHFARLYRSESSPTNDIDPDENQYLVYEQVTGARLPVAAHPSGSSYDYNVSLVKSAASVATATTYNSASHGLSTGDYVQVYPGNASFRPGIYAITVTGATTFTYDDSLVATASLNSFYLPCLTLNDYTPDALLADPLYTNPSDGEGILQANNQPPISTDMDWWQDRMWYSATTSKQRFILRMLGVGAPNGVQNNDTITIAGTTFTAVTAAPTSSLQFQISTAATPSLILEETAKNLVSAINRQLAGTYQAYYISGTNEAIGRILIEEYGIGGSSFTIYASRPGSWHPWLTTGSSGAQTSDNDACPNRLMYSKAGIPDAVPLLNYLDLGRKDASILRVMGLNNRLYVFKEDGLFTVSGQAPFRVDEFDPTCRLLATDSLAKVNGKLYGITNRGLAVISESGVRYLNDLPGPLMSLGTSPTFPWQDVWAMGTVATGLYILGGVDTDVADVSGGYLLAYASSLWVYDASRAAWAQWSITDAMSGCTTTQSISAQTLEKIILGNRLQNLTGTSADYYDSSGTVTVNSVSGSTVVLASNPGIVVGDRLNTALVTAVNGTTLTVAGGSITTGSRTYYVGYACEYKPAAVIQSDASKHFTQCSAHFKRKTGVYSPKLAFESNHSTTEEFVEMVFAARTGDALSGFIYDVRELPSSKRVLIPQNKHRAQALTVGLYVREAKGFWQLQGFSLHGEAVSDRGNR